MTEFALVVPVLVMLIMGVVDGALLMFTEGTARYAALEGSRLASQLGNAATTDTRVVALDSKQRHNHAPLRRQRDRHLQT